MTQPDFGLFAATSLDLWCTAAPEGYFTWVNARFSELLGWSDDELLGSPFLDLVHPDDLENTLGELTALSEGVPTICFTNRYRTANGTWVWLEWAARPVDGVIYACARDVTERANADNASARHIKWLELGFMEASMGYWRVDMEEETVFWSDEVYKIHGRDPATFTPDLHRGIEAYHPDDQSQVAEHVLEAMQDAEPFDFEHRIVRPNGEIRRVHSLGRPEQDATGKVVGIFGVFRDITDDLRVRRQQELEEFAFMASHDLKAPTRTITTYLDLLREDHPDVFAADGGRYQQYIQDAADRMTNLIDGMLEYATSGRQVEAEVVSLEDVLKDVCADLAGSIRDTGADVSLPTAQPKVLGDAQRLRQVFQNLLSNALKFSGDTPVIRVEARALPASYEITITDSGPGIPTDQCERIFEPFRQLGNKRESGVGIGLAIVQRIVRECGGRVWAESPQGEGAAFHVVLPAPVEEAEVPSDFDTALTAVPPPMLQRLIA